MSRKIPQTDPKDAERRTRAYFNNALERKTNLNVIDLTQLANVGDLMAKELLDSIEQIAQESKTYQERINHNG